MDSNSAVKCNVPAMKAWLKKVNVEYLKLLAEVLGVSVPTTRKKEMLVNTLVENKPDDISKILDEAKLIDSGFTIGHLKKVLVELRKAPVEEVKGIKRKRNLVLYSIIYLYRNCGYNFDKLKDLVKDLLKYANKGKGREKPVVERIIKPTKPVDFEQIKSKLLEYQDNWNNTQINRIKFESEIKGDTMFIRIAEEDNPKFVNQFDKVSLEEWYHYDQPLKYKRIWIKKESDNTFRIRADYGIDKTKKLGMELLQFIFGDFSIQAPQTDLLQNAVKSISEAFYKCDSFEEIVKNIEETKEKAIEVVKEKQEDEEVAEIVKGIKLLGLSIKQKNMIDLSMKVYDFHKLPVITQSDVLNSFLRQLIRVVGWENLELHLRVNDKDVKINPFDLKTELTDKELKAVEVFLDKLRELA